MLARQLRWFHVTELLLLAVLGAALAFVGLSAAGIVLWVAGVALGHRISFIALNFLLAALNNPERGRIPGAWRAFFSELWAYASSYSGRFLWPRVPLAPARPQGRPPVLLVHGYLENRATWSTLAPQLTDAGFAVYAVDLEPLYASIDVAAEQLARTIENIRAETGAVAVDIVTHSMGGLAARRYAAIHGDAAIRRLITIGTPHGGTRLAVCGLGRNAAEMRPGSSWLAGLNAGSDAALKARALAIASAHDNIVSPPAASRWPGAANVGVVGVGHIAMPHDPRVHAAVLSALAPPTIDPQAAR